MTMNLDELDNLGGLLDPTNTNNVLDLEIDLIDEDPEQPRTENNDGFSEESLNGLAETIKSRGLKTPISVRKNGNRYIINHGARRYRACKILGLTTIKAIIDNDYYKVDQVIENIQRNDLSAKEIADFIAGELDKGVKQVEIAQMLGKSKSYVSQYASLRKMSDYLKQKLAQNIFGDDITTIAEVRRLYDENPNAVENFLSTYTSEVPFTRTELKKLKDYLESENQANNDNLSLFDEKSETEADLDVTKEEDQIDNSDIDDSEEYDNETEEEQEVSNDNDPDYNDYDNDQEEEPKEETSDLNQEFHETVHNNCGENCGENIIDKLDQACEQMLDYMSKIVGVPNELKTKLETIKERIEDLI